MFKSMLYIFEADTANYLEVSAQYGPRAIARALGKTFDGSEWDDRHLGLCASLIADYTAGEDVFLDLVRELRRADLLVVKLGG